MFWSRNLTWKPMTWPFAYSHFPFAAINCTNSQTKWLVRPAEHGGPHTLAELPPRERQCDGRCRHHSFILGSSCQYRKEHLHSWINRSGEATNFQPVSSTYIFKFIASEFTLCLLPYFIFLQHISNKSSSALAKRSQSMMKSPPSNQLVSPTMKTAIAAKKASPPSYKRVAHQDIVIAFHSGRKGTQSDDRGTMKTPSLIRSVESCPNFPSLLAWPLQQQDSNSIGSINSADQATLCTDRSTSRCAKSTEHHRRPQGRGRQFPKIQSPSTILDTSWTTPSFPAPTCAATICRCRATFGRPRTSAPSSYRVSTEHPHPRGRGLIAI